ncbi:MAG: ATP-dependent 6-phosphofructokinase [Ruminococcaceae bacterium]|nr:ATP-dependent 6-phosphofructokinase [Oscillospiraceae bacterium]
MERIKKIGVLTSGGDAPGMNAAVRAITNKAADEGIEVLGFLGGYKGLLNKDYITLTPKEVATVIGRGGTFMYTDRCLEFATEAGVMRSVENCRELGIEALVVIGGDGTFRGGTDMSVHGVPTIGIPGTIDNDITATDYTIGYDTAMNTALKLTDMLRDTCESHARVNVVEMMGRHCGELTLNVAIASGAVATAIPEIPFDEDAAVARVEKLMAEGKRGMIVAVSEGVFDENGNTIGEALTKRLCREIGADAKFARLAHVQRGGEPTLRDRKTASVMGAMAIELIMEHKSDLVICEIDGEIKPVDIRWALAADRMYKKKLKDGDLDSFTADEIDAMEALCEKRAADVAALYAVAESLAK